MWVLYTSRSPSLIYQMPQLFSNFTMNFFIFFSFILKEKKSFCISLYPSSYPFSIFTFSQVVATCENLGDPFSGCRFLVQAAWAVWCASQIALLPASPGCDPPAVPGWSWLLLCALPTEPCMDINQGLSESEPCSAWTWKYLVRNRHRHGAKQWARGSEALWKVDRNSFFFF